MEFLCHGFFNQVNKICEGDKVNENSIISTKGKHVVVIGGGDTGSDCVRHQIDKDKSVTQLEILGKPQLKKTRC